MTRKPTARLRNAMREADEIFAHQHERSEGVEQLMESLDDGEE